MFISREKRCYSSVESGEVTILKNVARRRSNSIIRWIFFAASQRFCSIVRESNFGWLFPIWSTCNGLASQGIRIISTFFVSTEIEEKVNLKWQLMVSFWESNSLTRVIFRKLRYWQVYNVPIDKTAISNICLYIIRAQGQNLVVPTTSKLRIKFERNRMILSIRFRILDDNETELQLLS